MKTASVFFIFLSVITLGHAEEPGAPQILDSKEAKRIVGVLNYSTRHPNFKADSWSVFIPVAPELSRQPRVKTSYTPDAKLQKDKSGRAVAWANPAIKGDLKNELKVRVTFEATLHERHLRLLKNGEKTRPAEELSPVDRKRYLAELGEIEFTTTGFTNWMEKQKLIRGEKETELDFARRVFLWIKQNCKYDYREEMDRTATKVCRAGESDCCGLSVLFVSTLRANQIPARILIGRWAKSSEDGEKLKGLPYHQTHVKAEFFVGNIGWIPVDPSSAILHDRQPDGLTFFGHDPGDFLTFHVDPHIEVDSKLFGPQSFIGLQSPRWWVRGEGDLKPSTVTEKWEVKTAK